jgi:hypothetical protein
MMLSRVASIRRMSTSGCAVCTAAGRKPALNAIFRHAVAARGSDFSLSAPTCRGPAKFFCFPAVHNPTSRVATAQDLALFLPFLRVSNDYIGEGFVGIQHVLASPTVIRSIPSRVQKGMSSRSFLFRSPVYWLMSSRKQLNRRPGWSRAVTREASSTQIAIFFVGPGLVIAGHLLGMRALAFTILEVVP